LSTSTNNRCCFAASDGLVRIGPTVLVEMPALAVVVVTGWAVVVVTDWVVVVTDWVVVDEMDVIVNKSEA
jgi:hypothetical protein